MQVTKLHGCGVGLPVMGVGGSGFVSKAVGLNCFCNFMSVVVY